MQKFVVVYTSGTTSLYKAESLLHLVEVLTSKYDEVISITKLPDEDHDGVYTV